MSLYDEIIDNLGLFVTPKPKPFQSTNQIYPKIYFSKNTTVGYFAGCFGQFHQGHFDVIEEWVKMIKKKTNDFLVIIAPANADYTFAKYGDSEYAQNKYRFDQILLWENDLNKLGNWCIDLNPMLNFSQDHNYLDLLEDFLTRHCYTIDSMTAAPYILCGKDRDYRKLESITTKVKIFYVEGDPTKSSSALIKLAPKPRVKKILVLRCKDIHAFNYFKDHWKDQYKRIDILDINSEIEAIQNLIVKSDSTCCKDYKHLLPYIHISRRWDNPLLQAEHWTDGNLKGRKILDSDVYTGSTREFVRKNGGDLITMFDFSKDQDTVEVVDFDDFLKPEYRYPFTDISSRCSMQPFSQEMHARFENFLSGVSAYA